MTRVSDVFAGLVVLGGSNDGSSTLEVDLPTEVDLHLDSPCPADPFF